jgi:UTP--glucose-1-phosphate uridylyltransferase
MIAPGKIQGRRLEIQGLVEKPQPKDAPSTYAVIGKYICTAEVLTHIEQSSAGHADGEIRLIDGFRNMLEQGKSLLAYEIEGQRYDTGNRLGLLKASIAFSMKDPNLKAELQNTLREFL